MSTRRSDDRQSASSSRFSSPLLNIALMAIAAAWVAVLVKQGETKVERWIAAVVLAVVGLTGLFRIGTGRRSQAARKRDSDAGD